MNIHSTALVAEGARLGEGVVVGPWSQIGAEVALGPGCVVQSHCVLEGNVVAGARNTFGHGCIVGSPPQDYAFDPATRSGVRIGDGNTFREYVTIHRGTKPDTFTVVGNDCYLMTGVHLGHNTSLGHRVVMANNCLLAGYVEVGDRVVFGGDSIFHQFLRIGTLAMIAGGSQFNQDIPPFCLADQRNEVRGVNMVGMRRAGFSAATRAAIRAVYRRVFLSQRNRREVIAEIAAGENPPEVAVLLEFIRSSKRGVCRHKSRAVADDAESNPAPRPEGEIHSK